MQGRMTFVAAFHTFTIELNHSDRNVYTSFRIKVPRHELESHEHFYARLIAYTHAYRSGIEFTQSAADSKEATIVCRDEIGTLNLWAHVGAPEKRKLELSLKQHPDAEHRIYFYDPHDIPLFCHHLRGSSTNWVENVLFFRIDQDFLASLIERESSSPQWNISFIDDRLYLSVDGVELESEVAPIDIWSEFQRSLEAYEGADAAT
jgi:uncharacterized protein YaeQ